MNSNQSIDCLFEKGLISEEVRDDLQGIAAILPGDFGSLWNLYSSTISTTPPPTPDYYELDESGDIALDESGDITLDENAP